MILRCQRFDALERDAESVEALNRSVAHTAYHVGQIVYVARHFTGAGWKSLSIPKGRSAEAGVGTYKADVRR